MQRGIKALSIFILGFALIILVSLIVIIMLWVKNKVKTYAWFKDKTKDEVSFKEEYIPSLNKALGVLVFYGLLCPIALSLIIVIPARAIGFSENSPLVYVVTTLAQFGLLVLWLRRKYVINFKSMFSFEKIRAIFFIPMAVTILGSGILLSEVSNFFTKILPMNDFWLKIFNNLFGNGTSIWGQVLALVIAAPLIEEIIFRGLLLRGFLKHYSVRKSILLSALLFGIMHMNPWQFVTAFAGGIILGWWYVKTESIVTTIFGHALNNGMGFIISSLGLIIPGYNSAYDKVSHQPLLFDLLGIFLLILGILWLVKLFNVKQTSTQNTFTNADESNL